jgi:hypothetical protein
MERERVVLSRVEPPPVAPPRVGVSGERVTRGGGPTVRASLERVSGGADTRRVLRATHGGLGSGTVLAPFWGATARTVGARELNLLPFPGELPDFFDLVLAATRVLDGVCGTEAGWAGFHPGGGGPWGGCGVDLGGGRGSARHQMVLGGADVIAARASFSGGVCVGIAGSGGQDSSVHARAGAESSGSASSRPVGVDPGADPAGDGGCGDPGDHQSSGCRRRGGCEKRKFAGSGGGGRSSGTPSDPEQRWVSEFRSPSEMGLGKAVSSAAAESGPRRKITFGEILRSATDLHSRRQCSVAVGREEWLIR